MKKTKILLPFLGIGAIATTTGVMTSCSCGETIDFVMSDIDSLFGNEALKLEHVNLKKQTLYSIRCDLSKLSDGVFKNLTTLMIIDSFPSPGKVPQFYDICEADVLVNGEKLQRVTDMKELENKDKYGLFSDEAIPERSIIIGKNTFNKDSELIIKLQVSADVKDGCFIFGATGI